MIAREEEVRDGEECQMSLSEFEQFEAGSLKFVCNGQRMKPQKIKTHISENNHELWWVRFCKWPERSSEDIHRD